MSNCWELAAGIRRGLRFGRARAPSLATVAFALAGYLAFCGWCSAASAQERLFGAAALEPPEPWVAAGAISPREPTRMPALWDSRGISTLDGPTLALVRSPNYSPTPAYLRPWYLAPQRYYSYYRPWYTYGIYGPINYRYHYAPSYGQPGPWYAPAYPVTPGFDALRNDGLYGGSYLPDGTWCPPPLTPADPAMVGPGGGSFYW